MKPLRLLPPLLAAAILAGGAGPVLGQGFPLTPGLAPVTLAVPVRVLEGEFFAVRLRVDLRGKTGTCSGASVPLVLAAYSIPIRFDPAVVRFASAAGGSTEPYTSVPTFTNPTTANANGVVALTASQGNPSSPAGMVDVAVLNFYAVASSGSPALTPDPGSAALSSAFQGCPGGGFAGPVSIPAAGETAVVPIGGAGFYPLTPCRVFDTRTQADEPALGPSSTRVFSVVGICGIDPGAVAISANVTVTEAATTGEIRAYPGNLPLPVSSTVSFRAGVTRANNAVLGLATDGSGKIAIHNTSAGSVHVILDVNGAFR